MISVLLLTTQSLLTRIAWPSFGFFKSFYCISAHLLFCFFPVLSLSLNPLDYFSTPPRLFFLSSSFLSPRYFCARFPTSNLLPSSFCPYPITFLSLSNPSSFISLPFFSFSLPTFWLTIQLSLSYSFSPSLVLSFFQK